MDLIKAGRIRAVRHPSMRKKRIIVSLGDSYSSGEGVEPFYAQNDTDRYLNEDFLAHRSAASWPGRLTLPGVDGVMAEHRGVNWFFAASSGAHIRHVWLAQEKTARVRRFRESDGLPYLYSYPKQLLAPQIEIFGKLGGRKPDYVTITLGGNDAGFSEVIAQAMAAHTYIGLSFLRLKLASLWKHFYEPGGIRDSLLRAYRDISAAAGPQARLIVAGYPRLFGRNGSRTLYSRQAATLLNDSISEFNNQTEYLVNMLRTSGMRIYFVSVEKAFEAHEAYAAYPGSEERKDEIEFIHRVALGAGEHDIEANAAASAYSLHPNALGAEVYRICVQRKIDELEAGIDDERGLSLCSPAEKQDPAAPLFPPCKPAPAETGGENEPSSEKGSAPAQAKPSVLPYVIGGAAALLSVGALVGTVVMKGKARAIATLKSVRRCSRCGRPILSPVGPCPSCGAPPPIEAGETPDAGS